MKVESLQSVQFGKWQSFWGSNFLDNLIQRTSRILQFTAASPRDILSLRNWVDGTASLARDETDYLTRASDLFSVDMGSDDACAPLERMIEAFAERLYQRFSKVRVTLLSVNAGFHITCFRTLGYLDLIIRKSSLLRAPSSGPLLVFCSLWSL